MRVRPWIILAAIAWARIAFGYQFQMIAPLATSLTERFGLSFTAIGGMIGAYTLAGVFVALPLGLLARRFGDRLVFGGGLLLMTAGAAISAAVPSPSGIAFGRAVAGAGAVAVIVLQGKIVADWFTGPRFMMGISVSVCAYPIGLGVAQLILPPLAASHGLAPAFMTGSVPAFIALVLFLAAHREPDHIAAVPRGFAWPSARECLLLVIASGVWTGFTSGYAAYFSYLPASLTFRGYGPGAVALAMTIAAWGNVPGTLAGGGLAARFGGYRIFLIGSLALSIGMAGSAVTGWPAAWALLLGVVGSIQPGVIMAVSTLSARPENRAVGMGLFYTIYYAGNTLGPTLAGMAADAVGRPDAGLLAASAISLLAIPLYMLHRALARHETMLERP